MKAKGNGPGVLLLLLLSALAGAFPIPPALLQRAQQAQSRAELCFPGPGDAEQVHHCGVDEKLVFLHIPKNAGTAIEDLALEHGVAWGRNVDFDSCHIKSSRCLAAWHEPPALLPRGNPYSAQTPVFCVVRNPFLRVVSEYKYLYSHPEFQWDNADILQKHGCSEVGLNAWLVRALSRYQSGHSFLEMCHMLPQSFYIWGPPEDQGKQCQYCHEILRTEDLPTAFNALMESYNYSMRWNATDHGNAGGCPELSARSLNSTAIEHILRVYDRDFAMLNYSTDASQAEVRAKASGSAGGATGGAGGATGQSLEAKQAGEHSMASLTSLLPLSASLGQAEGSEKASGGAGGATGGAGGATEQSPQAKQAGKQSTEVSEQASGGAGGATGGAGGATGQSPQAKQAGKQSTEVSGQASGGAGGATGQSPQAKQAGKQGTASFKSSRTHSKAGTPIKVKRHGQHKVVRVVRQRSRPTARRGRKK